MIVRKVHIGKKMSEAAFVKCVEKFLCTNAYVRKAECHFSGDSDALADLELALERSRWPAGLPDHLLLEAKCHHSKDSANTINKLFGQLLKETGKSSDHRQTKSHCLGILIPTDGATWVDTAGDTIKRGSGIVYYREGFLRIKQTVYSAFGQLVNTRYVLAFSATDQELLIFDWDGFREGEEPISRLVAVA